MVSTQHSTDFPTSVSDDGSCFGITPEHVTYPSGYVTISGNVYTPKNNSGGKLPAIVVSHPMSGIKEQTAGLYAALLAHAGYLTLAFDAGYQGASTGEPRGLEDPMLRVEDIINTVTYVTTRTDVDIDRVGVFGICASGGYAPNAVTMDRRVKAVATVSGADVGELWRDGMGGKGQSPEVIQQYLKTSMDDRTAIATGKPATMIPLVPHDPNNIPSDASVLMKEASDYYRTKRAGHPRSTNMYPVISLSHIMNYTSYHLLDLLTPTPLLMIAGTDADTRYFSEQAVKKAGKNAELKLIDGATHVDMYDKPQYIKPAVQMLITFFNKNLKQ